VSFKTAQECPFRFTLSQRKELHEAAQNPCLSPKARVTNDLLKSASSVAHPMLSWVQFRRHTHGGNLMTGREPKNRVMDAKDQVVSSIQGVGDVAGATVDAVSNTIVRALKGTRAAGTELVGLTVDTVKGAVKGVAEVGMEVGDSAKLIMVGTLKGTQQVGTAGVETVTTSAAAIVKGTSEVGGNIGKAAKGAVEGAIDSARVIGVSAEEAASAAGSGAMKAAGEVGSAAVEQVRNVLTKTISGVKVVLREPFETRHQIPHNPQNM